MTKAAGELSDREVKSSSPSSSCCDPLQVEEKLLPEAEVTAPEIEQVTVDSDSLVSFLRHEQDLCRDSLSCRGSSESGSLQAAYAAHKTRLSERGGRRQEAEKKEKTQKQPSPERAGSLEEMQRTLASWKAERLQRKVSGKALVKASASDSASSTGDSSENVAPPRAAKEEDAGQRTLRLWHQLEEVKARAKEEEVRREREKNRAKGREFSERMRARQLAKGRRPQPSAK